MNTLFEYSDKLNNPCECFPCSSLLRSLPVKPHFHYFMEILHMTEGTIIVYCDGNNYTLSVGDMILLLPSAVHSMYTVSDDPFHYEVLKFDPAPFGSFSHSSFGPPWNLSALFASAQKNNSANIYFPANSLTTFPTTDLFHTCIFEMEQKQYGYQMVLQAKIQELLTYILRQWRENGFDTDALYSPAEQNCSIYNITEYIDRHTHEDLRVEELAKQCNMSYSYFAKNFKEVYGQSCKKYMKSMRLSKVENMLLFTNFDLNYISQEMGYSDCSHLIHSFKEKYGMTPHQYRMNYHV